MLRTGRSLVPPSEDFVHGASPAGSRLTVAVSYRAAWSLPEPVSHRLVDVDLCGSNPFWTITSFPESPTIWVHPDSGLKLLIRVLTISPLPHRVYHRFEYYVATNVAISSDLAHRITRL